MQDAFVQLAHRLVRPLSRLMAAVVSDKCEVVCCNQRIDLAVKFVGQSCVDQGRIE
jgi:hypothetical protein